MPHKNFQFQRRRLLFFALLQWRDVLLGIHLNWLDIR